MQTITRSDDDCNVRHATGWAARDREVKINASSKKRTIFDRRFRGTRPRFIDFNGGSAAGQRAETKGYFLFSEDKIDMNVNRKGLAAAPAFPCGFQVDVLLFRERASTD